MVELIRARWKGIAVAIVAVAAVFGVGLPADFADKSTELVAQLAAAGLGLYALGRTVWDAVQKRLNNS